MGCVRFGCDLVTLFVDVDAGSTFPPLLDWFAKVGGCGCLCETDVIVV